MKIAAAILFLVTVQASRVQKDDKRLCDYILSEEVLQDLTSLTETLSVKIRSNGLSWLHILRNLRGVIIARWPDDQKADVLLEAAIRYGYDPEEIVPEITSVLELYSQSLETLSKKHFPWDGLKAEAVFIQLWKLASENSFRLSSEDERRELVKSVIAGFCQ